MTLTPEKRRSPQQIVGHQEPRMPCVECGSPLVGRQAKFCSDPCRYRSRDRAREWKPQMTCADCGTAIFRGGHSLPQGEATCRDCRKAKRTRSPERYGKSPCADCGSPSYGVRCRPCCHSVLALESRTPAEVRVKRRALQARRAARMKAAPGLNARERRELLDAWRAQGRACAYCPAPVQTLDHVIPIALGGTNYEGNLAPACRTCNARKNDSLLIEWRAKQVLAA